MVAKVNTKKLIVYGVVPLLFTTILAGMYFSRNTVAQRLVSPKLPPLPVDSWREFGLLENAQNICLLAMFVLLLAGVWRSTEKLQRIGFSLVAAFTLFVLLEEVDYFTHWYRYFTSDINFEWFKPLPLADLLALAEENEDFTGFNIHNQGEMTKLFKIAGDFTVIVLFVILPLAAPYINNRYIRYAVPERYAILTAILMLGTSRLIHLAGKLDKHLYKEALLAGKEPSWELGSISSNLSEFRELNMYYLFLVYLVILVFYRKLGENIAGET